MSTAKATVDSRLLKSRGWDGCVEAHLLKADGKWQQSAEFRSHAHTLRRLFDDLRLDAVLCVDGRPTVCVLNAGQIKTGEVEKIRRQLWNLGATTLLLVESQHTIEVFSTLAKPSRQDSSGQAAQISSETIKNLESVELALRLRQLIRRVETGAIYREHKSLFDPKQAVDRDLLENLKAARNLICPEKSKKGYQRAHTFIGRFLFSCYLLDRGIIGPPYLDKKGLPEATDMLGLLKSAPRKAVILERLFDFLHRDFNGSLFGEPFPAGSISEAEVGYLQRLVAGDNLRTGQFSLFKLYDFSFIPVELISSIYEEFLGAEAEAENSTSGRNQPRKDGQRLQGAYYTPPRLAELTVDIATEGWDTLLDKRCLDPACGSGIFLVILFVRMAEEWRRRNPKADTTKRYEGLMNLLENNLHGVDIQLTACHVTCFSLYLAFLDQMEPREVMELRDALERDTRERLLPRILWERESPRPRGRHFVTVREFDFFALSTEHEFHLVIGNPPWVSRKPAPATESWLYSKANPFAKLVGWNEKQEEPTSIQKQTLFPAKEIACAFMWKAGLHLMPNGRVCQILPSRAFLSNNTDRFQAAWLKQHRLEAVWLLADYRRILFTAACPCFIGRYHPRAEAEALGNFEFITPKVELLDPRQAVIPVMPEDQKFLSEAEICAAAERQEAAAAWKKYHWGTPRDARLIERLMRFPKLSRIAKRPPKNPDDVPANRRRIWYKGQGFQPASKSTTEPDDVFWGEKDRFLPANAAVTDLVLLRDDTKPIGKLHEDEGLHRKRNPLLFKAPLLLINKACTKFLYSDFDVLFQDDFQSICAPCDEEKELLFLTAVFASSLAQYLLFHTTANIGIERDIARLEEMVELPFPLPEDMTHPDKADQIVSKCAECLDNLRSELSKEKNLLHRDALVQTASAKLNALVFDYFDLSEWERQLVADTVEIFRPSSTPGSLDSDKLYTAKPSKEPHRKAYAQTIVKTFRGWSRIKKHLWAEGCTAPKSDLAVVTLGLGSRPKDYTESRMDEHVEKILAAIRENSARDSGVVFRCLRGFAYYEPDRVHILKPLNRRHWTRTAALNDADEILRRMIEEGGWGV
jgi:hypothetical protein